MRCWTVLGVVIVEDRCMGNDHGLLGMNVITECWEGLSQAGHPGEQAFKSLVAPTAAKAWGRAFAACQRVRVTSAETTEGVVGLPRQAPIPVPADT